MQLMWKRLAMAGVVSLLFLAGPMTPPNTAAAQAPGVDKSLSDAAAAHDRAAKAFADTMTKMGPVKNMPGMDENEKTIVAAMQQMTDSLKTLLDANKATLDALKELRQMQK